MPFIIRDFKPGDVSAMRQIDRLSFTAAEQYGDDVYAMLSQNPQLRTLVAVDRDAIVGYALLDLAASPARLRSIAVHPALRNRGCGAQLLGECLKRFCLSVDLLVRPDNVAAIRLYENCGFVRTGRAVDADVSQAMDRYVRW